MKKFLATILCCLLAVSAFLMTGCSSVFDGNYTEATEQELSTFSQSVAANPTNEEFDYASGLSAKVKLETTGEYEMKVNMEFKGIGVDGDVQMQGKMDMTATMYGQSQTSKSDFYVKDETMYVHTKMEGIEVKQKLPISFDEYFEGVFSAGEMPVTSDLGVYLEMLSDVEGVKVLLDTTGEQKKVKIEIPQTNIDGVSSELVIVMVYDSDYKLTAMKLDMEMSMTNDGQTSTVVMEYTIEPWSGSVSLPSDLNTYSNLGF